MGLGSVLRFFLPHDDKFLPYFEQSADNLKEAAAVYASLAKATNREEMAVIRDQIKKLEHVGAPLEAFGFVLAHVLGQERRVFGLVLDRSIELAEPMCGARSVRGSALRQQSLQLFSRQRQLQSVDHVSPSFLLTTTMASSGRAINRQNLRCSDSRRCCSFCNAWRA